MRSSNRKTGPHPIVKFAEGLWTVSTGNQKTGAIPTRYEGATLAETKASCDGCTLAPWSGGGCYAWGGNVRRGANSVRRAAKEGAAVDLPTVLERTPRGARAVRFGAIGDPGRADPELTFADIDLARGEGFKVLGYTHHRAELDADGLQAFRHHFLASCETMEQAEEALAAGWLVALAGPESAPGFLTCPNWSKPWIQCNACGACDVPTLSRTKYLGIVFPAHGHGRRRLPLATKEA